MAITEALDVSISDLAKALGKSHLKPGYQDRQAGPGTSTYDGSSPEPANPNVLRSLPWLNQP